MNDLQYKYLKNAQRGSLKATQLKVLEEGLIDTYRTGFDAGVNTPEGTFKRGGNIFSWIAGRIGFARGKAKKSRALSQGVITFLKALAKDPNFLIKFDKAAALAPEAKKAAFKEIVSGAHNVLLDISNGNYTNVENEQPKPKKSAEEHAAETGANSFGNAVMPPKQQNQSQPVMPDKNLPDTMDMPNDQYKKRKKVFKEEIYKGLKLTVLDEESTTSSSPTTSSYIDKNVRIEPGLADTSAMSIKIDQNLANLFDKQKANDYIQKIEKTNIWKTIGINSSQIGNISKEEVYKKYGIDTNDFSSYQNSFQQGNKKLEKIESNINLNDDASTKQADYELKTIFYNMPKELNRLNDSPNTYEDQKNFLEYLKDEFENNYQKVGSRLQNIDIFNKIITNNLNIETTYNDFASSSNRADKDYYRRKFRESLSQPYVLNSFKGHFKEEISKTTL